MLIIEQFKTPITTDESDLQGMLARKLKVSPDSLRDFTIVKKSLDARNKPELFNVYSLAFSYSKEESLLKNKKINQIY